MKPSPEPRQLESRRYQRSPWTRPTRSLPSSLEIGTAAWLLRREIDAAPQRDRVDEVFLQVGNILQEHPVESESHVVEQHEVLMDLAHVAHVWDDLQPELLD